MARISKDLIARELLARHGTTFGAEIGIAQDGSAPALFNLLCAGLLCGAPVPRAAAVGAARAVLDAGWTTTEHMARATARSRTAVLRRGGYTRWVGTMADRLGATARAIDERYGGDLRALREEAGRDLATERALLTGLPGIGDVAADIFFREVQRWWSECAPFADERALRAAKRLGLGASPEALAVLVSRARFPVLVCALVRCDLEGDAADLLRAARAGATRGA